MSHAIAAEAPTAPKTNVHCTGCGRKGKLSAGVVKARCRGCGAVIKVAAPKSLATLSTKTPVSSFERTFASDERKVQRVSQGDDGLVIAFVLATICAVVLAVFLNQQGLSIKATALGFILPFKIIRFFTRAPQS